jgi:hypothetical protein
MSRCLGHRLQLIECLSKGKTCLSTLLARIACLTYQLEKNRRDSTESTYSEFDSYAAPRPSQDLTRVPSYGSTSSLKDTISTGSVRVDVPKVRNLTRGSSMHSNAPSLVGSVSEWPEDTIVKRGTMQVPPAVRRAARAKSQHALISTWSDTASVVSTNTESNSRSSSGNRKSSRSGRSRSRSNSRADSGYDISTTAEEPDQRETLRLPGDLVQKQREAVERYSSASRGGSSTGTASRNGGESTGTPYAPAGIATPDQYQEALRKRGSAVTVNTSASKMRRLDSVIGQLDFDDTTSR